MKRFQGASTLRLPLAASLAALTGFLAQVSFRVGPVPYTMQNTAVILAGLLLPPRWAALSQLLYLLMVALGLPVASGFRGGLVVLLGYTGGYLAGFPIASALMSYLTRAYLRLAGRKLSSTGFRDVAALLALLAVAAAPVYVLGFLVFSYYALGSSRLLSWSEGIASALGLGNLPTLLVLFVASVLVFIPQDLLVDHAIAVVTARWASKLLEYRGVDLG